VRAYRLVAATRRLYVLKTYQGFLCRITLVVAKVKEGRTPAPDWQIYLNPGGLIGRHRPSMAEQVNLPIYRIFLDPPQILDDMKLLTEPREME
jgi:hypothetical protein